MPHPITREVSDLDRFESLMSDFGVPVRRQIMPLPDSGRPEYTHVITCERATPSGAFFVFDINEHFVRIGTARQ